MKTKTITGRFLGIGMVLAIATITFSAQAVQQGAARVTKIQGLARYSTGNNVWLPLSVGTVLKSGAVIQTASESSVDIVLSGERSASVPGGSASSVTPIMNENSYRPSGKGFENVVRLRENTLLAIDRLTWEQTGADTVSDTQLDLRSGRIFGSVKKASAASRYEIKLPNGVAGIRGTIYDVSTAGIFSVYAGSVVITYVSPSNPKETITKVVNVGQQYDLNTDSYLPIPLSDAEIAKGLAKEISEIPSNLPREIISFTVIPVTVLSPIVGMVDLD